MLALTSSAFLALLRFLSVLKDDTMPLLPKGAEPLTFALTQCAAWSRRIFRSLSLTVSPPPPELDLEGVLLEPKELKCRPSSTCSS